MEVSLGIKLEKLKSKEAYSENCPTMKKLAKKASMKQYTIKMVSECNEIRILEPI